MNRKNILYAIFSVFIIFGTAFPTLAAEGSEKPVSPFQVNLKVDLPVLTIGTLTAVSVRFLEGSLPSRHYSLLDSSRVNPLDRSSIGYHYPGWGMVGDIGTILVPAATLCMSFIEVPKFGWYGFLEDFLIVGEAVALSSMLNQIVAGAMPRPRPYMYRVYTWHKQARNSSWDWRSFYSGHAGSCFAATIAFSYIFTTRYPDSKWIPAVWVMSVVTSSLIGISRPLAGEHFWTDTIIGSVMGCAWGLLIPVLHQRKTKMESGDVSVSVSMNTLSLTCYF